MGTHLSFSTAFHPQSSGQVERVNQILEDMLRACVISFGKSWENSLPFAEFAYNNSFQSSLGMAPFEFLYGRKCRTPLNWSETGERQLFGPDMIQEAEEKVRIVREQLKTAQSRQKSYYDRRHRPESYELDEKAYLRVTPLKGTHRFGIKGKLAPRYIGPFRILAKHGEVAYQLELPPHLSQVHDVFHVSQLRRCFKDPIREVDHEMLDLQENLSYREYHCKARYAVLFQIRTFPPEPEDEAHIGPTATYDEVIYPGFQHDITALQIQGYNISYNRHTSA